MKKYIISIIFLLSVNVIANNDDMLTNLYSEEYNTTKFVDMYDPYEVVNRKIFAFNNIIYGIMLRPIVIVYDKVLNKYSKDRIINFLDNFYTPITTVNSALQLDQKNALKSLWRFIINSTLGIAGLFDVASKFGLKAKPKDFGSTLAKYGAGPGAYIMLPFFGPSNLRDMFGTIILDNKMNILDYKAGMKINIIVAAANMINNGLVIYKSESFGSMVIDPYIFVKSIYYNQREAEVDYPGWYVSKYKK